MRDALGDVQSAVVLGGSSEIALATIDALIARRLKRVTLAVRNIDAAASDAVRMRGQGVHVDVVAFDADALDEHEAFVESLWGAGDIDLVIVAFGILGDQARADRDRAHAMQIVHTNFTGAVSVLVPLATRMAQQGHGTITVLSSVAAMRARRANFVYASSKAGLDAFSSGLAEAYNAQGVHIMTVRPGFVATKMTANLPPAPFATTPAVVAAAIVDGIKARRHVVYAPGILQIVMPVLRSLPRVIWNRLGG